MKKRIVKEICIAIILMIIIATTYVLTRKDIYIELKGDSNVTSNIYSEYIDDGVSVLYCGKYIKFKCIDITDKVKKNSNININNLGSYKTIYSVDYKGINKTLERSINIVDNIAPTITFENDNDEIITTCPNKEHKPLSYIVTDNYDNDLTDKVIITKSDLGITYTVTDSSNNTTSIFKEYKYNDSIKPEIVLNGYSTIYLKLNNKYVDDGYTAKDNCDGDITSRVKKESNVDITKEGEYYIKYTVSDNKGNNTSTTRKVKVYEEKEYNIIEPNGKVVYLTFDDGPSIYTKRLLDILDYYNVKATFFVTNQFPSYSYYIKEEYNKGHSIGIHTYSHVFKSVYSSIDGYFNDLNKMDEIIYNQTGIHSNLVRFPGGSSNTVSCGVKGLMRDLTNEFKIKGYKYFDWNVESNDTSTYDSNKIANNVINGIKNTNNAVVLQHDIKPKSIEAVAKIIEYGKANGYTFLPITDSTKEVHHTINKCHR